MNNCCYAASDIVSAFAEPVGHDAGTTARDQELASLRNQYITKYNPNRTEAAADSFAVVAALDG